MQSDITLPKNNETEFMEIASRLGIRKLCFLYDFDAFDEKKTAQKLESTRQHDISIEIGFLVNQKNFNKAAKHSLITAAKSSGSDRLLIESGKVKIIYGFEELYKRDYLHQRASGLNHVLCDLANKNNVTIGFSYSALLDKNLTTSELMGRMIQNIRLCKKFKTKIFPGSFSENPFSLRQHHDVANFFSILGIDKSKRY